MLAGLLFASVFMAPVRLWAAEEGQEAESGQEETEEIQLDEITDVQFEDVLYFEGYHEENIADRLLCRVSFKDGKAIRMPYRELKALLGDQIYLPVDTVDLSFSGWPVEYKYMEAFYEGRHSNFNVYRSLVPEHFLESFPEGATYEFERLNAQDAETSLLYDAFKDQYPYVIIYRLAAFDAEGNPINQISRHTLYLPVFDQSKVFVYQLKEDFTWELVKDEFNTKGPLPIYNVPLEDTTKWGIFAVCEEEQEQISLADLLKGFVSVVAVIFTGISLYIVIGLLVFITAIVILIVAKSKAKKKLMQKLQEQQKQLKMVNQLEQQKADETDQSS